MNTALSSSTAYGPSLANLRNLLAIRSIAVLGQTGALAYVLSVSRTTEGLLGITVSLVLLALLTAASLWRTTRPWPVTDTEFLIQLLLDVLGWTALMYFSGGANNPFVSYYIVPLVVAAAVLPWRYTWLVTGASLGAYSLLIYYYVPFPLFSPHAGHGSVDSVHTLGMWFNFLFSAGLITYFVVRMATTLRHQEAAAAVAREERLRNDQIMAVASLAAGTAHELGTPLSTMTVLVDEMLANEQLDAQSREDCELLRDQLGQCKATLRELVDTAEVDAGNPSRRARIGEFATHVLERWAVRRPGVSYRQLPATGTPPEPDILWDSTLAQALENLLNNAADTGTERVEIQVSWDLHWAQIQVRDFGPGIENVPNRDPGTPVLRAGKSGLGIGLMLSHAAVERHGGDIELHTVAAGGALACLRLPVAPDGNGNDE